MLSERSKWWRLEHCQKMVSHHGFVSACKPPRSERRMAAPLQHRQAPFRLGMAATRTGGYRLARASFAPLRHPWQGDINRASLTFDLEPPLGAGQADPPRHRNEAAPRHVVSTKPLSRPSLPAAEPGQASAVSSDPPDASAGGLPGAKGETSAGDVGLGGAGTVSDAQAMPSPNNPAPTYPPSARRAGRAVEATIRVPVVFRLAETP